MSSNPNRALVKIYIERVLNQGDLDLFAQMVTTDYLRHVSPTAPALNAAVQTERLRAFRHAFPDLQFAILDLIAEGDRVVFRTTLTGTQSGVFQGIEPTHRRVEISDIGIIRVEDGKLAEHWGGPDLYALFTQLGAHMVTDVK